jgi:putative membrane protein
MMHWGTWCSQSWGTGFGWIFILLFWGVILGIAYCVQLAVKIKKYGSEDPMDILQNRYARGAITKDQFDGVQQDL